MFEEIWQHGALASSCLGLGPMTIGFEHGYQDFDSMKGGLTDE
jgi:hypothetical protein